MNLLAEIVKAINGTPNDMELGKKVREIFDAAERENLHRNFKLGEHIEYPTSVVLTLNKSKLTNND